MTIDQGANAVAVLLPLRRMWERASLAKTDSETAAFFDLMYLGELATKLATLAVVAAMEEDRERHKYRLEHRLVRADGVGEWVAVLDDALVGPASHCLTRGAMDYTREFTQTWAGGSDSWQRRAIDLLESVCRTVDEEFSKPPGKTPLRWWFQNFAWLRNRTRGHGAITAATCEKVYEALEESLLIVTSRLGLFTVPWVYLRRNLSGKYRVLPIGGEPEMFTFLKSDPDHSFADGVYLGLEEIHGVSLLHSDSDLSDFFVANGAFRDTPDSPTYETFSYLTDTRSSGDGTRYLQPTTRLPASETEGHPHLDIQGSTFANVPPRLPDYVSRMKLESELHAVLLNDRHPIVSLVGSGGIGKTSLALDVLHAICDEGAFFAVVWFSARDIDLLPEGPKVVQPKVLTHHEIAQEFTGLMNPQHARDKGFQPLEYLAESLSGSRDQSRILFVFDNFETVRNPGELYQFIDSSVRLPNKVLLTSRSRDFKADYPVEVSGMNRGEFDALAVATSARLGIGTLLTDRYLDELFDESDGHPYVVKVLLGEVARTGKRVSVKGVMASKDKLLDALFERTFSAISPASKRVFLTLCNWRSLVPRVALEGALLRPGNERMDVRAALDSLERSSLIEVVRSETSRGADFLRVPLAAAVFGSKKLAVSAMKPAIDVDTEFLRCFGAMRETDVGRGLAPRVERMVRTVAQRMHDGEDVAEYMNIVEYVAGDYPDAWLLLADLQMEAKEEFLRSQATNSVERFLEAEPTNAGAWYKLAEIAFSTDDTERELTARFRLAELPAATYEDISLAANCLNRVLYTDRDAIGDDEKRLIAGRLISLFESRMSEADGAGLSRLAWLHLHLKDDETARAVVLVGLDREPYNTHLRKLAKRLDLLPD